MARVQTTVRLTAETLELRKALSAKLGISPSAVMELAVHRLADVEGVKPPSLPERKTPRKPKPR